MDKLLAHAGYGTRKEVKGLLKNNQVTLNGELIKSDKVKVDLDKDEVAVDGTVISYQEYVYYMLNKPVGYVSATLDNVYPTVIDLIDDVHPDLFPVGRLDVDTRGLLLITNDGALGHRLTSPKHHVDKTYEVLCEGLLTKEDVKTFAKGIVLDDFTCKPAMLEIIGQDHCYVTIQEGKFHQVKRMFLSIDKPVTFLKRVAMGPLKLDPALEEGEYRPLSAQEIDSLKG
jgi:16S rRNA pseudouridine516 synthase